MIDLRSDTVTRPSQSMLAAMSAAEVGDDVWGDDPTVIRLQAALAERTGKEAGLFFPSGTQSNLAALMAHCARGDEYIGAGAWMSRTSLSWAMGAGRPTLAGVRASTVLGIMAASPEGANRLRAPIAAYLAVPVSVYGKYLKVRYPAKSGSAESAVGVRRKAVRKP